MIFVLWGEDKSTKNTLALSAPKPLVDMEFDIGGFDRSCRNLPHLPIKDWYDEGLIRLETYPVPFQIGKLDPIASIIRPSKIVVGMKELFYSFAAKYIQHLQDPNIKSIMVDTGTLLYDVTCQGYLQELQEKQLIQNVDGSYGDRTKDGKPLRTQLQQIEYREPYIRMRGFAYQAKAAGKHLIVTHHASDEYGVVRQRDGSIGVDRTGKRTMHGWSQWGDSADIVGHTYWDSKERQSYFSVELAEVKELEGMVFKQPTYDRILEMVNLIKSAHTEQEIETIIEQQKGGLEAESIRKMLVMMRGE